MTTTFDTDAPARAQAVMARSRDLYFALSTDPHGCADAAAGYLRAQLAAARALAADLPERLDQLDGWMRERTVAVGEGYRAYLAARKAGSARRYFTNKSHALYFLQGVAPTKLVDGAWLYSTLRHWDNPGFHDLIRTYLEELGDGLPDKNHVTLYRKLLATHGCDDWRQLDDHHFVQGAIQLALAWQGERFLPELIGYNLGYEQLPLHLLVTAYELNELGIDPYYFTLHVTVDNSASGHAHKAVRSLLQLLPRVGDRDAFLRRVLDGYRLNELGASTTSVIAGFDLQTELVRVLAAKSVVGKNMHSDYCRVEGRSVSDWLASPAQVPGFLAALEQAGWIRRGEDPAHSRFWRLVHGERAGMFGVFSAYEQQLLRDWIASTPDGEVPRARVLSHRARTRTLDSLGENAQRGARHPGRGLIRRHGNGAGEAGGDSELRELERRVAAADGRDGAMAVLVPLLSPAAHHTAPGLMATRLFARLLDS